MPSCRENPEEVLPTCQDGVQNGDETGVDCGGTSCALCPTCEDSVQNQGEEGIDCGGPCPLGCYTAPPCTLSANTLTEAGNVIATLDSFEVFSRSNGLRYMEAFSPDIYVLIGTFQQKDRDGNYIVVSGNKPLNYYKFAISIIFNWQSGYDTYYATGGTIHLQLSPGSVSVAFCDVEIEPFDSSLPQRGLISGNMEFPN